MVMVRGKGALGVWHDVVGSRQRDAEDWYNREHHAERIAIAGFLRARRYVNRGAGPRYFSRYDVTEDAVLASAPYLAALDNPSGWSRKIFPHYRNTIRGAFTVVARAGDAEGGFLTTLRFGDGEAGTEAAPEVRLRDAAAALVQQLGVVGVEVWRVNAAVTTYRSREKELRGAGEPFPGAVLVVESSGPELAAEALGIAVPADLLGRSVTDVYQLVFQAFAAAG